MSQRRVAFTQTKPSQPESPLAAALEQIDHPQYVLDVTQASDETTLRLSLTGWLPPSLEACGAPTHG